MNNNNISTPAQRQFIDSLAKGKSLDELQEILAPAFRASAKSWEGLRDTTLNHKTSRLDKIGASKCIEILKELQFKKLQDDMCANLAFDPSHA